MPRATLTAHDLPEPLVYTLHQGTALLVGRAPDPLRLRQEQPELAPFLANRPLMTARIESPRVSANHLLLLCADDETVSIYETHSRNGTALRLQPGEPVRLLGDVSLELSPRSFKTKAMREPRPPVWQNESDFGKGVESAINEWFSQQTVDLRAELCKTGAADRSGSSFQLADDQELHIRSRSSSTYDPQIGVVFDRIGAYVHEQNLRFEQYRRRVDGMIVASPLLREALRRVAEAGEQGRRTVILGPTGSGKEWLARCYHRYSPRNAGPFAALNCALLDKELLYAQLFGAKRGSFTGAVNDVQGLVEAAHEGTLFLDELGEMSLEVQKALLRFLDTRGEYQRLGDPKPRKADVQIVCASNKPLDDAVYRLQCFRDDLWYRLSSAVIRVPALHERPEDILAFLQTKTVRGSALRVIDALTEEAKKRVLDDPFPGNFRDLENFVERLPPVFQPREIDAQVADAALREGRAPPMQMPLAKDSARFRRPRTNSDKLPTIESLDWKMMAVTSVKAFIDDEGGSAASWGELQTFIEKYLKPVFIAYSTDLHHVDELSKNMNFSALARKLNIADGSTVKMHLSRYVERFRTRKSSDS
jgi:DNA-binding NtrC family response regulator